jgi:hypothetical protein
MEDMSRVDWEALGHKRQAGMSAWNPHAKYWRAFQSADVVAVVGWEAVVSGLWQAVQVELVSGAVVWRRLTF